ncbi:hypothetical protein MJO28_011275 [Puccinia striiformis f. sp. tritici]|uniref:Uncharacterized protein n=1 Tax=Puccinia striiformis f. sp. tritici TaxID=168172 RepID=A0ACC0E230_9BASI|nr:hypothetical protein MJO28_011275 [Puccinia striiformis f. sp. tritici]
MDPSAPLVDKIIYICDVIQHLGLNPKSFITSFLEINNPDLKSRRGYWGISRGWPSTFELLGAIQGQFMRNAPGALKWSKYIQDQNPTSGIHPNGSYISSAAITPEVFNSDSKERHYEKLTTLEMPFLYQMLMRMLSNGSHPEDATEEELHPPVVLGQQAPIEVLEEDLMEREGFEYARSKNTTSSRHSRYKRIAFSVCGMLSFAKNRRHNVLQVENSIRFLACGMSERVNEYLHHVGLTSSRQTAIDSLRTLSAYAESNLRKVMALEVSPAFGPFICIDNLDMEERVHLVSVGHRTMMFHGTWGYIHTPPKALLESLDLSEITLQSYNQALQTVRTMNITPRDFLPDRATEDHYVQVWKSQLATVMKKYIAIPATTEGAHPTQPPPLEVLSHAAPDFHMLKLMDEADNSAEGIGQVMESIRRQTGLTPAEFVGRLQPMEGDLGTCQNFHSMRALRAPNNRPEENMNNITFQLGASHTLWNIGQTIFTKHFGDSNNGENMGAWRTLNALGTPPNKVLQKKDFTGMIRHLERVHEATLFHCLRVIMKIEGQPIRDTLPTIPTSRWNQVIDDCYLKYCSPAARRQAYEKCRVDKSMQHRKLDETELDEVKKRHKQSKLSNLLVRLHEFSTVVEANRAMKQGDIGRLINIWRMWSVMSQSLPGLTHYATYLPRLVILLTKVLPPSLSKFFQHSMLVSPSGRPGHFVAKDFFLENHNYWLKFFYNRGDIGTQVERLKELFSLNIPLLRSLFHSMQLDSGKERVYQSHKVTLSPNSLQLFRQMAFDSNLLDQYDRKNHYRDITIDDSLVEGVGCFQDIISHKDHNLSRLRSHIPTYHQRRDDEEVSQARNMLMSDEDAMGSDKIMDESDNPEEMDPPSSDCM